MLYIEVQGSLLVQGVYPLRAGVLRRTTVGLKENSKRVFNIDTPSGKRGRPSVLFFSLIFDIINMVFGSLTFSM